MVYDDALQAPIWAALSDPKRRKIISLLQDQPLTTSDLCAHFEVSRYAVMKHLKVLEKVGLINVQREGRQRWNVLNTAVLPPQIDPLIQPATTTRPIDLYTARLRLEIVLNARPTAVFTAFTCHINQWWPDRVYPDASIELEAWVNGRFYECVDTDRAGMLLATVTAIQPAQLLRLQGPMGITDRVAISQVEVTFSAQGDTTLLQLVHHIAGEVDNTLLAEHGRTWQTRLDHSLRQFVESGQTIT